MNPDDYDTWKLDYPEEYEEALEEIDKLRSINGKLREAFLKALFDEEEL